MSLELLKAYLQVVTEGGSVKLVHPSGSYIEFREDGNINISAARNIKLDMKDKLLIDCSDETLDG